MIKVNATLVPPEYAHADFARMVAILAHGTAQSKPFLDGNKPLAFNCLSFLLAINGDRLDASADRGELKPAEQVLAEMKAKYGRQDEPHGSRVG